MPAVKEHSQTLDLLVTARQIFNNYTGEILEGDVVVRGQRICYVGPPFENFRKQPM